MGSTRLHRMPSPKELEREKKIDAENVLFERKMPGTVDAFKFRKALEKLNCYYVGRHAVGDHVTMAREDEITGETHRTSVLTAGEVKRGTYQGQLKALYISFYKFLEVY